MDDAPLRPAGRASPAPTVPMPSAHVGPGRIGEIAESGGCSKKKSWIGPILEGSISEAYDSSGDDSVSPWKRPPQPLPLVVEPSAQKWAVSEATGAGIDPGLSASLYP